MKIGIDCRLINKIHNTGISRYTEFLIDYYIAKFGVKNIFLITNDTKFNYKRCEIIYTKFKPYNIVHFIRFSNFISSISLDILHIPFYSALFRKNNKIKVIVTVHDLMYRLVENFFDKNKLINNLKLIYFDFIVNKSLKNADFIVSVSKTTRRDVLDAFGLESIHIPEDSNIEGNEDLSILNRFNLIDKGFFFYCGNNRPHKNISFITEIFKDNKELPPLVLAGSNHIGCENIIATGIVSEEELRTLYKSAIAFIFPSKYEGFGLPVLESLRLGTFVIASKIPAFLEFNSNNILFFDLNNSKEFLEVISKTRNQNFKNEKSFFDYYDKNRIYKLNDLMLKDLVK